MQQFLDSQQSEKVTIAVDHREDELFDELFKKMGAEVDRRVLDVGDFLCSSRLVIERKTRSDFEQSIIDGRLFSQLQNLIANYERVVILVEGVSDEARVSRNALLGAYASIISDFGASLMFTRDKDGTADLIFHLAKHEQLSRKQSMRIYAKRRTFTPSQTARSIVESLPMVGPKSAKALLKHFGTVEALAKAQERDIAAVPGIGKKKAKVIRSILAYEYSEEDDRFEMV